jgi:hypothetical protein
MAVWRVMEEAVDSGKVHQVSKLATFRCIL